MAELLIDRLHPHTLTVISASTLPIFGMYQMDAAILKSAPCGSATVDVFEPLNSRALDSIKAAEIRYCPTKHRWTMILKVRHELAVDFASLHNWGNQHSHRTGLQHSDNRKSSNLRQIQQLRSLTK